MSFGLFRVICVFRGLSSDSLSSKHGMVHDDALCQMSGLLKTIPGRGLLQTPPFGFFANALRAMHCESRR